MNFEAAFNVYARVDFGGALMKEVSQRTGLEIPIEDDAPVQPGLQLFFAPGAGRLFIEAADAQRLPIKTRQKTDDTTTTAPFAGSSYPHPKWEQTWDMARSTIIMPCNTSGWFDPAEAARYGECRPCPVSNRADIAAGPSSPACFLAAHF